MADLKICEWPCSYYNTPTKRWLHGNLRLTKSRVKFSVPPPNKKSDKNAVTEEDASKPAIIVNLLLDNVTDIKKAASAYVFKCVVITAKDMHYWFSSLPNRESVFNVLNHFWRNRLMPTPEKRHSFPSHTKRGADLLKLARDSEETLEEAGRTLMRQGESLDYSLGMMFGIHEDLDVAEKTISTLDSWFGRWRVPKAYVTESIELINAQGIPIVHEFPILFIKGDRIGDKKEAKLLQTPGILRVSKDGVTILTEGHMPCYHYTQKDVSVIHILTPWKLVLSKYLIGEPDVTFTITSSHMVKIIRVLEIQYKRKFHIDDVPENVEQTFRMSGENRESLHQELMNAGATFGSPPVSPEEDIPVVPLCPANGFQGQVQGHLQGNGTQVVSTEEAEELSQMIGRMKTMALDISVEQDRQMETIEDLTKSVDRANDRLNADTRKMKKMM